MHKHQRHGAVAAFAAGHSLLTHVSGQEERKEAKEAQAMEMLMSDSHVVKLLPAILDAVGGVFSSTNYKGEGNLVA